MNNKIIGYTGVIFLFVLLTVSFVLIKKRSADPKSIARQSADLKSMVDGNTAFAIDLYSVLKKEEGNIFFSPYSISSAMAMTYGGARTESAVELEKVFHFMSGEKRTHEAFARIAAVLDDNQKKSGIQLYIANSLWVQKDRHFKSKYNKLLERYYGVKIKPLDYKNAPENARKTIIAPVVKYLYWRW